ncbi:MAG: RES family NAD+ phosphorylase [Pseudomonadota bacterium]|nr:RES family NAD+ phosphorylase [Pseudomonadota bacterium]
MSPKTHTPAYRIVSRKYPSFDGTGAYRWGSRWTSPGRWVVYAAETYALAVLENLVHWQTNTLPPTLVCVEIKVPDEIDQEQLDRADAPLLPNNDYNASRAVGDDWYDRSETAVLWVPSVVSPYESNILFNQRHRDFSRIIVGDPAPAYVDPRLWRSRVERRK